MDRRSFIRRGAYVLGGATLLGGGSMLSGCGSHPSAPPSSGKARPTGPPKRGGDLKVGVEAEENGIDPTGSDFATTGLLYARAVYDPLAATAADGSVVPYLAQSIDHNADYSEWTIKARPGVTFHDGVAFDAAAIVANFEAQLSSSLAGPALSANLTEVSALDSMTVKLTMKEPWVPFDTFLCGWIGGQFAYMASPKALKAKTLADHPVGTGPFIFKEWVPNSHLSAIRNPSYWRGGLPYVDSVSFHPLPDDQSRVDALEAGDIDIMHITDVSHYLQARANSGYTYVDNLHGEVGEPDEDFIMLNVAKPPLNDLRVRQALAYSMDTSTYNKFANQGVTQIDFSPFQKGSPYYARGGYPSFDLAKAKDLVKKVQAEQGGPITIDLGNTTGAVNGQDMAAMAQMWTKAGIVVNQKQVLQDEYIIDAALGSYSAFSWRQFGATDPDQNYTWWISSNANPIGKIGLNFARNKDPQIDAALKRARQSADPAVRTESYRTVSERINGDLPYIWLNRALWALVARPGLQGYDAYTLPNGQAGLGMKIGVFPVVGTWFE